MTDQPPRSHGRLRAAPSLRPRELMAEPQVAGAWTAQIVTLFPEAFPGTLGLSLTGRALAEGLWNLRTVPLRQFGEGVERVFPLYSTNIETIEVVRRGRVRRAKLYYLRDRRGKSARIAEVTNYKPKADKAAVSASSNANANA